MRLFVACVVAVAWPMVAAAAEPGGAGMADVAAQAEAHLQRGLRDYEVQRYREAIDEFRAGYQLDPRPAFLYALGQAERLGGDCAGAVDAYRAFLRTAPPARQAKSARQNIERCQAQLASAPAAAIRPGPATQQAQNPADAASQQNARQEDIASQQNSRQENAASQQSGATTAAAGSSALVAGRRAPWYRDAAGGTLTALGVVGLGVGGALWGVGEAEIESANAASRYDDFVSRSVSAGNATTLRTAGIVTVAAGGVLAVAGLIRYLVVARRAR